MKILEISPRARKFLTVLCAIGATGCLFLMLPSVRQFIVYFAEWIFHDDFSDGFWMGKILHLSVFCFFVFSSFFCISFVTNNFVFKDSVGFLSRITRFSIKWFIPYFLLFIFLFGIRVYYISQKEGLHVDEGLSCSISSYNEYGYSRNYETKHAYTGQELKEITYWDNDSVLNAFGDVGRLYKDNRDSSHTNLYYSVLRLWFAGVRTGDLKTIINRGCGLNLLFFSISFVLMYLLAKKLFNNDLLVFLTLFLAFINTGSISNTLYLRTYQLQEACFIAVTLLFVKIVFCVRNREQVMSWKNYFICVFCISIALLSGYFAVFYIALLGLLLLYTLYKNKQTAAIPFWMLVFLSSLVFANILYPQYFHGFFSFRGSEALNKLGTNAFLENFKLSVKSMGSTLVYYLFYFPVLILVLVQGICFFIFKNKSIQHDELPFFLFIGVFIWCCIIMFFAPFKGLRYMMPSFPLLMLGLVFYFDFTVRNGKSFFVALYAVIFILGVVFATGTGKQHELSYSKIENIYPGKGKSYVFNKYPEIPVAIVNNVLWEYASLIPYLNDKQVYYFFDTVSDTSYFFAKTAPHYLVIEDKSLKKLEYQIPEDIKRIASVPPFTIFSFH